MIVPMRKVFIVARRPDQDRLLEGLGRLGVLHLQPVDAARAAADAETIASIERLDRAIQILEGLTARGQAPDVSAAEAAEETLRLQREAAERAGRLSTLHRQIEQLAVWGDVRLEQFEALRRAGLTVRVFAVPRDRLAQIDADAVDAVGPWPNKRTLVATVCRGREPEVPEGSEPVPLPARDRPSLRAEAAEIDTALQAGADRLAALVHLLGPMQAERRRVREEAHWTIATRSALADDHLYGLQGWVPADRAESLAADLRFQGVDVAVQTITPQPDEEPPTLVQCPWWAKPMEGLFNVLGTVPGYREFDVSAAFMIALPIFSAIMISDAGYGLLYLLMPVLFYRKMAAAGVGLLAKLVIVIGALSLVWGLLTASCFGFDISRLMGLDAPPVAVTTAKEHMNFLMRISFILAVLHLSFAHVWLAKAAFPGLKCLGELGWAVFLWGMFGVVNMLLLGDVFVGTVYPYLLIAGAVLAILFAAPGPNVLKMVGVGLAKFPLAALGTLGDTISYVRLMALGVAGTALALAFNDMASAVPFPAGIPILIVGHALNVALSVVSLLAHGVRLNVLEFSNNLGMQMERIPLRTLFQKSA